jgi:hypothetical protein
MHDASPFPTRSVAGFAYPSHDRSTDPLAPPENVTMSLSQLAAQLFDAERAKAAAERLCETLRDQVKAGMEAELDTARAAGDANALKAAKRLELVGQGTITYVESGSSERLDQGKALDKLAALGARLRDLGEHDVDDAAPFKSIPRAASVRVTPQL